MKFALKIGWFFFFKVMVDYNNENERSNRGVKHLKFFFHLKNDYSKNISRTFSGVVWTVWSQCIFR